MLRVQVTAKPGSGEIPTSIRLGIPPPSDTPQTRKARDDRFADYQLAGSIRIVKVHGDKVTLGPGRRE